MQFKSRLAATITQAIMLGRGYITMPNPHHTSRRAYEDAGKPNTLSQKGRRKRARWTK